MRAGVCLDPFSRWERGGARGRTLSGLRARLQWRNHTYLPPQVCLDIDGAADEDSLSPCRRGVREAEGAGLENQCGLRLTVGSNPTLSASIQNALVNGCRGSD